MLLQLLLKKQDGLLSSTCLDPSPTSVNSPSGSIAAYHEPSQVISCSEERFQTFLCLS